MSQLNIYEISVSLSPPCSNNSTHKLSLRDETLREIIADWATKNHVRVTPKIKKARRKCDSQTADHNGRGRVSITAQLIWGSLYAEQSVNPRMVTLNTDRDVEEEDADSCWYADRVATSGACHAPGTYTSATAGCRFGHARLRGVRSAVTILEVVTTIQWTQHAR